VQRLERDGLVSTEPYKPVELTTAGQRMAKECKERHEIVYEFLRTIGVDQAAAEVDAEGIEHHVSPATLAAFKKIVENKRI
jgi:DtxR family manganese transport transcriptional regulator